MIDKNRIRSFFDTISALSLLRFGITGVLTAILYFLVLIAAVEFAGLPPVWGAIIAFCLPLPLNYFLHRNWSFESGVRHISGGPRFLLTVFVGLGINALVMYAGTAWMHFHYLLVQMAAIAIVISWNFIIFRIFVFYQR